MSAIANNGRSEAARVLERGRMTREQVIDLGELTARDLLGVSLDEAFAMLDRGELNGSMASSALRSLRFLLAA